MGVQTLKNAVILATVAVAAVILIQGAGPSVSVTPSHASVDIVAGSPPVHTTTSELSAFLGGKVATASVAAQAATTATVTTTTSAATSTAPVSTTSATTSATASAAAIIAGRTLTTTPATVETTPTAPTSTPTPPPAPPAAPTCPSAVGGSTAGAPGSLDAAGVQGTTTADIASFASEYNAIRVSACLQPIPFSNIRYSPCLQQRMWWMADDPSTNPASAWGHTGNAVRSDGVPIVGCDGDLAGGDGYSAASVADAWWASPDHKASLFEPTFGGNVAGVCIAFAMTHGGINVPLPNEPFSFVRAAAYWYSC